MPLKPLNTLNELANALGDDANFSTTILNRLTQVDTSCNDLSGVVTTNIGNIASNTSNISSNTSNILSNINNKAPKDSPTFSGNVAIGTTDPSGRFDVFQNPDEENVIIVSGIKGSNAEDNESYKKRHSI